jgi:release factor glutamine methyltransferase
MLQFLPNETIRQALTNLAAAFRTASIETPEADARILLAGVLGLDGTDLIANPDRALGAKAAAMTGVAHFGDPRILRSRL